MTGSHTQANKKGGSQMSQMSQTSQTSQVSNGAKSPSQSQNSIVRSLSKAVNNPVLAVNFLKNKFIQTLGSKNFIGVAQNRSDSENGDYVAFVEKAIRNYKVFSKFKLNPSYQVILEHVPKEEGAKYLDLIAKDTPEFIKQIEKFKINDLVGSPITHSYPSVGVISPTTLRYIKVASDLKRLFGNDIGNKIVEIGVGYGGQFLIIDQAFSVKEYHLYDLPPILELTAKYLESHTLNSSYKTVTLNQNAGDESYDLAISNYALSEIPKHIQIKYCEKILSKSSRGYLTMNSGLPTHQFASNRLSIEELRSLLPPFEVLEETPRTSPDNFLIVWGHKQK